MPCRQFTACLVLLLLFVNPATAIGCCFSIPPYDCLTVQGSSGTQCPSTQTPGILQTIAQCPTTGSCGSGGCCDAGGSRPGGYECNTTRTDECKGARTTVPCSGGGPVGGNSCSVGVCCDYSSGTTGVCSNPAGPYNCTGPRQYWVTNGNCNLPSSVCPNLATGSCCVGQTCYSVTNNECAELRGTFTAGGSCGIGSCFQSSTSSPAGASTSTSSPAGASTSTSSPAGASTSTSGPVVATTSNNNPPGGSSSSSAGPSGPSIGPGGSTSTSSSSPAGISTSDARGTSSRASGTPVSPTASTSGGGNNPPSSSTGSPATSNNPNTGAASTSGGNQVTSQGQSQPSQGVTSGQSQPTQATQGGATSTDNNGQSSASGNQQTSDNQQTSGSDAGSNTGAATSQPAGSSAPPPDVPCLGNFQCSPADGVLSDTAICPAGVCSIERCCRESCFTANYTCSVGWAPQTTAAQQVTACPGNGCTDPVCCVNASNPTCSSFNFTYCPGATQPSSQVCAQDPCDSSDCCVPEVCSASVCPNATATAGIPCPVSGCTPQYCCVPDQCADDFSCPSPLVGLAVPCDFTGCTESTCCALPPTETTAAGGSSGAQGSVASPSSGGGNGGSASSAAAGSSSRSNTGLSNPQTGVTQGGNCQNTDECADGLTCSDNQCLSGAGVVSLALALLFL